MIQITNKADCSGCTVYASICTHHAITMESDIMDFLYPKVDTNISDYVLKQEGVVYGAGYTDHFQVIHKRLPNKEERNKFKGSKYVQSDLRDIFSQVKTVLKQGLTILFSITLCQTAGLASYIGKRLRD